MRSECMSTSAQYDKTVRMGGGVHNSIPLNVWTVSTRNGSYNYTAQLYITPVDCITVMTAYAWNTAAEKVRACFVRSIPNIT